MAERDHFTCIFGAKSAKTQGACAPYTAKALCIIRKGVAPFRNRVWELTEKILIAKRLEFTPVP